MSLSRLGALFIGRGKNHLLRQAEASTVATDTTRCTPATRESCRTIAELRAELVSAQRMQLQLQEELAHVRSVSRLILDDWDAMANGRKKCTKKEMRAVLSVYRDMI